MVRDDVAFVPAADSHFDAATAVTPSGTGTYLAEVHPDWSIGTAPNGGYLLAIAQRALAQQMPLPDPLTITGHFLASPDPGQITLEVTPLRLGRTLARGEVLLRQRDRLVLRAVAAFGRLPESDPSPRSYDGSPPDLPPRGDCLGVHATTPDGRDAPLRDRFEILYHPDAVGWFRSAPNGQARISAWARTRDERPLDAHLATLAMDMLPSAAFELGLQGWIPTIELTVHHRAKPAAGWMRCAFRSRFVSHGLVEEDGELWDDAGTLVAMSRQLSLAPTSDVTSRTP